MVLEQRGRQRAEHGEDRFLLFPSFSLFCSFLLRLLLLTDRKILESCFVLQASDTLRARLKVQAERPLHRDLPVAEVGRAEYLAIFAFFESQKKIGYLRDLLRRDFSSLVAQTRAHRDPEAARVDELHLSLALALLPVRENPNISGNACVVEELLRHGDERFQPVVLQDPAADFALPATSIAGEQRRAVHDDRNAAAALIRVLHPPQHVLKEQQLPVADAREPCPEPSNIAARGFR